jgi:O-antigen/teichoic acid export membrane protein
MSLLKRNIVANFLGQAGPATLAILLVPIYVQLLGTEGFGLVGLFSSLQAVLAVLDLGLSTTTNREISRTVSLTNSAGTCRDLVRTFEITYLAVGCLIGIGFVANAHAIATGWVHSERLSADTIRRAVMIFGITVALRWPIALYVGVLRGLERQVLLNCLAVTVAILRSVGAVAVLLFVSPTVTAFLSWQLLVGTLEVLAFAIVAWHELPQSREAPARFEAGILRRLWKLSARMSAISILAVILKQTDRILISKLLPLDQLGYYSVAATVSAGLLLFSGAVFAAVFPRFGSLLTTANEDAVGITYHRASQIVAYFVAPMAAILIFFSRSVLELWTGSTDISANAHIVLSVLALAALINSMMQVPYALQLASGIVWLPFWTNAIGVLVLTPLTYVCVTRFGIAGAGIAWASFNVMYYGLVPRIMHRHVLRGHLREWVLRDTLPFAVLALSLFGVAYALVHTLPGGWALAGIAGAAAAYFLVASHWLRVSHVALRGLAPSFEMTDRARDETAC